MNISKNVTIKELEQIMITLKEKDSQNLSLADIVKQIEKEIINIYVSKKVSYLK
ncbi:MAG TPA: hypothetical protein VNR61_03555 [Niallia sp.]|nr:hypothetical protein [Niallia sp.]